MHVRKMFFSCRGYLRFRRKAHAYCNGKSTWNNGKVRDQLVSVLHRGPSSCSKLAAAFLPLFKRCRIHFIEMIRQLFLIAPPSVVNKPSSRRCTCRTKTVCNFKSLNFLFQSWDRCIIVYGTPLNCLWTCSRWAFF